MENNPFFKKETIETKPSRERNEEKLSKFIAEIAEKLKAEGVPVNEDCRIDMDEFSSVYGEDKVNKDKEILNQYNEKWYPGMDSEKIAEAKKSRDGEKLEMLKTALFSKFLSEDFIIARSSEYDDVKNGVDNIILERKTGNLVCAFDEVADMSGERYDDKVKKVLNSNKKGGGASLEYGVELVKGKLIKGRASMAPVFYLALPKDKLKEGMENFIGSFDEKSEYEQDLFNHFISSLYSQYTALKLEGDLKPVFKARLNYMRSTIDKLRNSIDLKE